MGAYRQECWGRLQEQVPSFPEEPGTQENAESAATELQRLKEGQEPKDHCMPDKVGEHHFCVCVCVCVCQSLSNVQLFATPWTVVHQVPLSMGFSRPLGLSKQLFWGMNGVLLVKHVLANPGESGGHFQGHLPG